MGGSASISARLTTKFEQFCSCQSASISNYFVKRGALQASLRPPKFSPAAKLKDDNEQTGFYTGLSSFALFSSLLNLLTSVCNQGLSIDGQFLLVLTFSHKSKHTIPSGLAPKCGKVDSPSGLHLCTLS